MVTYRSLSLCTCLSLLLAACGTQSPVAVVNKGSQYYGQRGNASPAQAKANDTVAPTATAVAPVITLAPSAPISVTELPAPSGGTADALDSTQAGVAVPPGNIPSTAAAMNDPFVAKLAAKEAENRARMEAIHTSPPPLASAPQQGMAEPMEPMAPLAAQETSKPAASSTGYIWPVKGVILSQFGDKLNGEMNDGMNISAMEGQPIVAAADGDVVFAGNELKAYGNMVILRHADGVMTAYAHAERILVSKGEKVRQGAAIATVGQTGDVQEPQLHFGVRKHKQPMDPLTFLP